MTDRRRVVIVSIFGILAAFVIGAGFIAVSRAATDAGIAPVPIASERRRVGIAVTPPPDADCTDRVVDSVSDDSRTIELVGGEKYDVPSDRRDDVVGWDGADVRYCDAGDDRKSLTNAASDVTIPVVPIDR